MTKAKRTVKSHDESKCFRCQAFVSMFEKVAILPGSFRAILCVDCLNDWELFIRNNQSWLAWVAWRDKLQAMVAKTYHDGKPRRKEMSLLRIQETEIDEQLFAISEKWCDDRIERPKPEREIAKDLTPEEIEERRLAHIESLKRRLEVLEGAAPETSEA